jgi:hypothetical protein
MIKILAGLLAASIGLTGAAKAEELAPMEAQSISLGDLTGVAYYTVADDGFRVVVTLAAGEAQPVRFSAALAPGQSIALSVPQGPGETAREVEIRRSGDVVSVSDHPDAAAPGAVAAGE